MSKHITAYTKETAAGEKSVLRRQTVPYNLAEPVHHHPGIHTGDVGRGKILI